MSLKARLSYFDVTMLLVSMVVGIGIFKTSSVVAKTSGSEAVFYTCWILGGIISICGALSFAEIGSRYPVAGGQYKLFSYCYHPVYAFMLNWVLIIINAASTAGVAIIGAQYINPIIMPESLQNITGQHITVISIITILFIINFIGVKSGARVSNMLTVFKILMILVFSTSVFYVKNSTGNSASPLPAKDLPLIQAIIAGLAPVLFTYGGYQQTLNFGGDIENPRRNLPLSIITGISIVVLLYIGINMAYVNVLGLDKIAATELPARELSAAIFGDYGSKIISVVIFFSVCGFVNAIFISNPRMYLAMAQDKVLPQIFGKLNEKTQVQEFALGFFYVLIILSYLFLATFSEIMNYVMFIDCLWLASAGAAIFILRKKMRDAKENYTGFRVKPSGLIPAFFILAMIVTSVTVLSTDTKNAIKGFVIFLAGAPIYFLMTKLIAKEKK